MPWQQPKTNWTASDAVGASDLNRIEGNEAQLKSDLDAHTAATTGAHGATSAATANRIVQRDSAGRAKFAAPSASDDAARKAEVDAVQTNLTNHIADYVRQPGYAAASGSANAYSVTLNPAPSAYVDGMCIAVKINVQNTGPSTINVNGLGAKTIKKPNGNDVSAGNLKAGSIYTLRYNGTNFILQGEGGSGTAQPSDVLSGKTFTNDAGEQTGTMPNRTGHVTGQSISRSGTTLRIRPQSGYYPGDSGNSVQWNEPNLLAQNIRQGVSIFGLAGTLVEGKKFASGQSTTVDGDLVVYGLSFRPELIAFDSYIDPYIDDHRGFAISSDFFGEKFGIGYKGGSYYSFTPEFYDDGFIVDVQAINVDVAWIAIGE